MNKVQLIKFQKSSAPDHSLKYSSKLQDGTLFSIIRFMSFGKNWSDLHQNFIRDLSLDQEGPLGYIWKSSAPMNSISLLMARNKFYFTYLLTLSWAPAGMGKRGTCPPPSGNVKCFMHKYSSAKRSIDDLFMHYFHWGTFIPDPQFVHPWKKSCGRLYFIRIPDPGRIRLPLAEVCDLRVLFLLLLLWCPNRLEWH